MRLALRLASVACQLATVVCPLHQLFLPQKLLHWPIALLVRVCWSVQAQIWLFFGLIMRKKRHDNDLPKSQGRGIAA